jgi:hypothetical protein
MFRFTIRDLVLVTLVVAMGVAWWLDHQRGVAACNALQKARESDDDQFLIRWEKREREWTEANRWWRDAERTWRSDRMNNRS